VTLTSKVSALPRIVVVGCGDWGKNLVRAMAALGALVGVADKRRERARALASQFNVPVLDVADALADPSIDGVVLAVPITGHAAAATAALEASKHVFVEKPLADNAAQACQLRDLAAARGRVLMAGHLLRYHDQFARLVDWVHAGELGTVQRLEATRTAFGKLRGDEDVVLNLAPHDVSMILALMATEPTAVTARGVAHTDPAQIDTADIEIDFASGARGIIHISRTHPLKQQRLVVIGTRGSAVFDDRLGWDEKLQLTRFDFDWADPPAWPKPTPVALDALPVGEPLKNECQHFLDCIQTGTTPISGPDEAIPVTRVLDQIRAALYD
jgi:predicted dehydrogenase